MRRDEWYNFRQNPRGSVNVLATLDERTYTGGTMAPDHPIVWSHTYEGGRSFYTAGRAHAGKLTRRHPSSTTSGEPFSGRLVRYDFGECHLKTNRFSSAAPISRS